MRTPIVTVIIVVFALLAEGTARADDREIARAEFTLGQEADRLGHYQEAIEHYQRANDKLAHAFTSFNIAVDFDKLGKPRDAVIWYRRYIDQITDATEKAKTEALIEKLRSKPGVLVVRTKPSGARVYIDGKPVGVTPYSTSLPGGLHLVGVVLDGQNEQRDVSTEYGERTVLDIRIRGVDGQLIVAGTPAGALVTIDDQPAGTLPTTSNLEAGRHHVHVSSYGMPSWDQDVEVHGNDTVTVDVKLGAQPPTETGPPGGTTTTPPTTGEPQRVVKLSYLVGAAGGADARGNGAIGLVELGLRSPQAALVVQVGKGAGGTMFTFLIRYSFLGSRLSPYVGLGYAGLKQPDDDSFSGGLAGEVGLHLDMIRSEHGTLATVVSAGAFYTGSQGDGMGGVSVTVPLTLAIEGSFGN